MPPSASRLDARTLGAAKAFLERVRRTDLAGSAMLYGSRARGTHSADSDVDIAVILSGVPKNRYAVLGALADAACDVLLETGLHIQPLPL